MASAVDLTTLRDRADNILRGIGGEREADALDELFSGLHSAMQINIAIDQARDAARSVLSEAEARTPDLEEEAASLLSGPGIGSDALELAMQAWRDGVTQLGAFYDTVKPDHDALARALKVLPPDQPIPVDSPMAVGAHLVALRFMFLARQMKTNAELGLDVLDSAKMGFGVLGPLALLMEQFIEFVERAIEYAVETTLRLAAAVIKGALKGAGKAAAAVIPTWLWVALGVVGVAAVGAVVVAVRRGGVQVVAPYLPGPVRRRLPGRGTMGVPCPC